MTITAINKAIEALESTETVTTYTRELKEITKCEGFGMFVGTGKYHYVDVPHTTKVAKSKKDEKALKALYKERDKIALEKWGETYEEHEETKRKKLKQKDMKKN